MTIEAFVAHLLSFNLFLWHQRFSTCHRKVNREKIVPCMSKHTFRNATFISIFSRLTCIYHFRLIVRSLQVTDIACFRIRWICDDLSILYINSVLLRSNLGKLQIPSNNISSHFKTKHLLKGSNNDYYIDSLVILNIVTLSLRAFKERCVVRKGLE